MNILVYITIGAIIGWLANLQFGGASRLKPDVVSGIIGATICGLATLSLQEEGQLVGSSVFEVTDIVIAVGGAIAGVFMHRAIRTKRTT
jgi:uncharacterized membrane protein YeaQ/YmgE (transglycosylase-associated protein family)